MKDIAIWVITCGRALVNCVTKAFAADGLIPESAGSLSKFPTKHGNALVFLDVCRLDGGMPAGLRAFLRRVRGVSVIAVCDPATVSAAQMAELLNSGADDIIPNTIQPELLRAKISAHMRRLAPALKLEADVLVSDDGRLRIDKACRSISLGGPGGLEAKVPALTPKEFDLLCLLVSRQGQALSRTDMLLEVWRIRAESVNSETVDRHIESLRKKLGNWGRRIKTLYGVGYMYENGA